MADKTAKGAPTDRASVANSQAVGAAGSGSPRTPLICKGRKKDAASSRDRWIAACHFNDRTRCNRWA
ncbi:hypothetical protein D3C81_1852850 [compost metagenome]